MKVVRREFHGRAKICLWERNSLHPVRNYRIAAHWVLYPRSKVQMNMHFMPFKLR